MRKLFVNPEINTVELSQPDAIMVSGEVLVKQNTAITYSISDKDRDNADRLNYWAGKN